VGASRGAWRSELQRTATNYGGPGERAPPFESIRPEPCGEILLVEAFSAGFPSVPLIACFRYAFHPELAAVAALLPIRSIRGRGVRRYGFPWFILEFLMGTRSVGDPAAATAHLWRTWQRREPLRGSAESRFDTSMSFTRLRGAHEHPVGDSILVWSGISRDQNMSAKPIPRAGQLQVRPARYIRD